MGQLQQGQHYCIGLSRYEWRWTHSRQLISFADFDGAYPGHNDSCIAIDMESFLGWTIRIRNRPDMINELMRTPLSGYRSYE